MKNQKRYRLIIEDESCLEKIGQFSFSPRGLWTAGVCIVISAIILGFIFVLLTPAKRLIPGYYQPSQRAASEEALTRLDSIIDAYRRNEAYLHNVIEIINNQNRDSVMLAPMTESLPPDSLLPTSEQELRFNREMQQREKFNISIVAPLVAEGMLFYPVNRDALISNDSRFSEIADIILPAQSDILAVTDGTVIDVSATLGNPPGNTIVIQHNNGFISKYSGLGKILVECGDNVPGGKVIALSPTPGVNNPAYVKLRMWHNGTPLIPYNYISGNFSL